MNEEDYNKLLKLVEKALETKPKLSEKQAYDYMTEMHNENKVVTMLWKICDKEYERWYKEHKSKLGTTLFEETMYIVSNQNKAFGNYGGYSIFASSLASRKRNLPYGEIDRIEHLHIEYAVPFYEEYETLLKEVK